jgi:hypothetical protein
MFSGEATNTNLIVFGLTRPGLEPTIYHTRGEHANHYATDAVWWKKEEKFNYTCTTKHTFLYQQQKRAANVNHFLWTVLNGRQYEQT